MIVTVDPEFRLKLVDDVAQVGGEGRSERAAVVSRLDGIRMGGMVCDHDRRPVVRPRKFFADKCQIQAMIVERLPCVDH